MILIIGTLIIARGSQYGKTDLKINKKTAVRALSASLGSSSLLDRSRVQWLEVLEEVVTLE